MNDLILDLDLPDIRERAIAALKKMPEKKTALIAMNDYIGSIIYDALTASKVIAPDDFFLITYNSSERENLDYPHVDFKYKLTADMLLDSVYTQIKNKTNYDVGKVILPEFHLTKKTP